jgi:hypothetical protein
MNPYLDFEPLQNFRVISNFDPYSKFRLFQAMEYQPFWDFEHFLNFNMFSNFEHLSKQLTHPVNLQLKPRPLFLTLGLQPTSKLQPSHFSTNLAINHSLKVLAINAFSNFNHLRHFVKVNEKSLISSQFAAKAHQASLNHQEN